MFVHQPFSFTVCYMAETPVIICAICKSILGNSLIWTVFKPEQNLRAVYPVALIISFQTVMYQFINQPVNIDILSSCEQINYRTCFSWLILIIAWKTRKRVYTKTERFNKSMNFTWTVIYLI